MTQTYEQNQVAQKNVSSTNYKKEATSIQKQHTFNLSETGNLPQREVMVRAWLK